MKKQSLLLASSPISPLLVLLLLLFAFVLDHVVGNNYDPHKPPEHGTFFEGWYTRIVNSQTKTSVAYLAGSFCSKNTKCNNGQMLPGYVAILFQGPDENKPFQVFEAYVNQSSVKTKGQIVTEDPDFLSPPDFMWTSEVGYITQDTVSLNIKNITFQVSMRDPQHWNPKIPGEGPGGVSDFLPLQQHWFVYSLGSKAKYVLSDDISGKVLDQGIGLAHQEKNWGESFPDQWVWSQGIIQQSTSGRSNEDDDLAQFALSGGSIPIGPFRTITTWLVGYRSKKLNWNFRPQRFPHYSYRMDSCSGVFHLTAESFSGERTLVFNMKAPPNSFTSLAGPTEHGFVPKTCVESYSATVLVEAYEKNVLVERREFKRAALEFGGKFMCSRKEKHRS